MEANSKSLSLMATYAGKLGVSADNLRSALLSVAFRVTEKGQPAQVSNEELLALVSVANAYNLNPFLRHIYAFRGQNGCIQPLISIDGWLSIMQNHPAFDGMDVSMAENKVEINTNRGSVTLPEWCEVRIYRKDCAHPVVHREYSEECFMATMPWIKYPRRMLKHRTTIQCIRYALGVSGAFDEESVREGDVMESGNFAYSYATTVEVVEPSTPRLQASSPVQSQASTKPAQIRPSVYPPLGEAQLAQTLKAGIPRVEKLEESKAIQWFEGWINSRFDPANHEAALRWVNEWAMNHYHSSEQPVQEEVA